MVSSEIEGNINTVRLRQQTYVDLDVNTNKYKKLNRIYTACFFNFYFLLVWKHAGFNLLDRDMKEQRIERIGVIN